MLSSWNKVIIIIITILCSHQNRLEMEKKNPESLPGFNFCRVMNKNAYIFIFTPVAMATAIFYF